MLDYSLHKKYHPTSTSFLSRARAPAGRVDDYDFWPLRMKRGQKADETLLMIMPLTVDGFNFQSKTWGK